MATRPDTGEKFGNETISEMNKRLHRERRWVDFMAVVKKMVERGEASSKMDARRKIWHEWLPLSEDERKKAVEGINTNNEVAKRNGKKAAGPQPFEIEQVGEGVIPDEAPAGLTYWDELRWAAESAGRRRAGQSVNPKTCPSWNAWGLYGWALESPDKFYAMWAAEGRKQSGETAEEQKPLDASVEEMRAMARKLLESCAKQ